MIQKTIIFFVLLWCYHKTPCAGNVQIGPDPWNYKDVQLPSKNEHEIPPDLRIPVKKEKQNGIKHVYGEWWFKRLLAIMLKNGQMMKSEDGDIDISLQMKFEHEKWGLLDDYLKSEETLTEVKLRRAVGYIEDAIYKPTITDKIVMAWSDYVQVYLMEYKAYITYVFGFLAAVGAVLWLWSHMSHRHVIVIIIVFLYIYEVIISYKEAEKQEFDKFMSAVNVCKWYFWTSECTVPPPDPILFMKHMNPLNIAIRMVTSFISEPIITINSTIKILIGGITDGLWYPLDKIVSIFLIVVINISLIFLLVMLIFNFIFNIPFNLNFLGIIGIGVKQNRPSVFTTSSNQQAQVDNGDRISGERLDRILNVCSLALSNAQNSTTSTHQMLLPKPPNTKIPQIKRSASTGRLQDYLSNNIISDIISLKGNIRKRTNIECGDGDHK